MHARDRCRDVAPAIFCAAPVPLIAASSRDSVRAAYAQNHVRAIVPHTAPPDVLHPARSGPPPAKASVRRDRLTSEAHQDACLVWLVNDVETSCHLGARTAPFVIGRSSRAEVRINDDRASRRHAEIYWEGQRWWVRDAGSRNGTYLGIRRILRPVPLTHGDSVRCGETTVNFLWPASIHSQASSQPQTLASPAAPALSQVELDLLLALCSPYATGADPRSEHSPAPLSNAEIADRLHLSEDGVRQRLKRLYPKFALSGSHLAKRRELAARAIESGALGGLER